MVEHEIRANDVGWIKRSDCSWLTGDAELINTISASGGTGTTSAFTATTKFVNTHNMTTGVKSVEFAQQISVSAPTSTTLTLVLFHCSLSSAVLFP